MLGNRLRLVVLGLAILVASGSEGRAQWGFPGGFGDFGWGGWGATTAMGDEARGMGLFAAGLGQYNLNTAQAQAIEADTVMRFNEYLWESQRLRNQRHFERLARQRAQINENARAVYDRLSNNPERRDVHRGDALNVLVDQLTAPTVYSRSVSAAGTPLTSALVRDIPFRYAPHAITISLDELAHHLPAALQDPRFQADLAAIDEAAERARAESEESEEVSPETIQAVRTAILALRTKVRDTLPAGRARSEAERFLKAALGLARMMEAPDTAFFLRELGEGQNTTLGALLAFMQSFNLRFGVADTPSRRNAYDELFTAMREMRTQLFPQGDAPDALTPPATPHPEYAESFFSAMPFDDLENKKPLTPSTTP